VNRTQKKELVDSIHGSLNEAKVVLVSHYKGLTVSEITALRGKVRAAGASFKVTKNRLTQRALEGTQFAPLAKHFTGPTAVVFAAEPVAAAKALVDFAKDNEKLVVIGGAFGAHALDTKGVEALAKMPSLNELRAKIVGMLQTPATRIAGVLQAPGGQIARVLGAHAAKG